MNDSLNIKELAVTNKVYAYGDNSYGKLGLGLKILYFGNDKSFEKNDRLNGFNIISGPKDTWFHPLGKINKIKKREFLPTLVEGLHDIIKIACGVNHTIFLNKYGRVYVAGGNYHSEIGLSGKIKIRYCYRPRLLNIGNIIIQIACGDQHSALLTDMGLVYTFGCNIYGQLGRRDLIENRCASRPSFVKLRNVKEVKCGWNHTIFLTDDGLVYGCGDNSYGQIGLGRRIRGSSIPLLIENIVGIESIACGSSHTILIGKDKMYVFGDNRRGQLGVKMNKKGIGLGDNMDYLINKNYNIYNPLLRNNIHNFIRADGGEYHTIFINKKRQVYGCGSNIEGQLGFDNTEIRIVSTPTLLEDFDNIKEISCGKWYTILVTFDGNMIVFGYNWSRCLGYSYDGIYEPFCDRRFTRVITAAAGLSHTIVVNKEY